VGLFAGFEVGFQLHRRLSFTCAPAVKGESNKTLCRATHLLLNGREAKSRPGAGFCGMQSERRERGASSMYFFWQIFNLEDYFTSCLLLFSSTFISDASAVLAASRKGNN
jgi:hypothetical protein